MDSTFQYFFVINSSIATKDNYSKRFILTQLDSHNIAKQTFVVFEPLELFYLSYEIVNYFN